MSLVLWTRRILKRPLGSKPITQSAKSGGNSKFGAVEKAGPINGVSRETPTQPRYRNKSRNTVKGIHCLSSQLSQYTTQLK